MFTSTVEILLNIIDDAIDGEHRAKAELAYDGLTSFNLSSSCILRRKLWKSLINFVRLCKANLKTF